MVKNFRGRAASTARGQSVFGGIVTRECREPTLKRFKPPLGSRITGVARLNETIPGRFCENRQAAVATGGLSILAKATWDRLVRSGNPCETAAQQGREALQGRFAAFPDDDFSED